MTIYNTVEQAIEPIGAGHFAPVPLTQAYYFTGASAISYGGFFWDNGYIIPFFETQYNDDLVDYTNGTAVGLRIEYTWAEESPGSDQKLLHVNHYRRGLWINETAIVTQFTYDAIEDVWNPVI